MYKKMEIFLIIICLIVFTIPQPKNQVDVVKKKNFDNLGSLQRISETNLTPHEPIYVENDSALESVAISGTGAVDNPYILENWNISNVNGDGIFIGYTTKHFVVRNCWIYAKDNGIRIYSLTLGPKTCSIINNTIINGGGIGINVHGAKNSTLINNSLINNAEDGIFLRDSEYSILHNNSFSRSSDSPYYAGIYVIDSHGLNVTNNTFINTGRGIYLDEDHYGGSQLAFNTFIDCGRGGIEIDDSGGSVVEHNRFINCGAPFGYGNLYIETSNYMIARNNSFLDNNYNGIYLDHSDFSNISMNLFTHNREYGVYLDSYSDNNTVHHNTFFNNSYYYNYDSQGYDDGWNNVWYDLSKNEGNSWSDHIGTGSYAIDGSKGSTDPYPIDIFPPEISLISPLNNSYNKDILWLNFTINEPTTWIGYSLDGEANITISENRTFSSLSEGIHYINVFANDTSDNMGVSATIWFTVDSTSPSITIISPINSTYSKDSFWLNFTISEAATWTGYSLDGLENVTITGNTSLSSLSEGSHWIIIYARDSTGNVAISATIWFTVDSTSPSITIISPINSTYSEDSFWLNFTVDEPTSWIGYSLDGQSNVTISSNTSLSSLSEGPHWIVIYARDYADNEGISVIIWFTIDVTEENSPQLDVYGLTNSTVYSGNILVTVTIIDESDLSSALISLTNGYQTKKYLSEVNLTLINVTGCSWTFSISFDTTQLPNGEYQVFIEVLDIFENIRQTQYKIFIQNEITSTSTTITQPTSSSATTTTKTKTAPLSSSFTQPSESKTSPTWTLTLLLISFTVIILLKKLKHENV